MVPAILLLFLGTSLFGDDSAKIIRSQLTPDCGKLLVSPEGAHVPPLDFSKGKSVGKAFILSWRNRFFFGYDNHSIELTYNEYRVLEALSKSNRIEGDIRGLEQQFSLQGKLRQVVSTLNAKVALSVNEQNFIRLGFGTLFLAPQLVDFPVRYLVDPDISLNRDLKMVKFQGRYVELPGADFVILEAILSATKPISPEHILAQAGIFGDDTKNLLSNHLKIIRRKFRESGVELDRIFYTVDFNVIWIPRVSQKTDISVDQKLAFRQSVVWGGEIIPLSPLQYRIFQIIRASGTSGVSFETIAELAKIDVSTADKMKSVQLIVFDIRSKFLEIDSEFYQIVTVPSFGYSWVDLSKREAKAHNKVVLDPNSRQLLYNGKAVTFSQREFSVFNILFTTHVPIEPRTIIRMIGMESENPNILLTNYIRVIESKLKSGGLADLGHFRYTADDRAFWITADDTGLVDLNEFRFSDITWKGMVVNLTPFQRRIFEVIRGFGVNGVDIETINTLVRAVVEGEGSRTSIESAVADIRRKFKEVDPDFYGLVNLPKHGYAWVGDLLQNNLEMPDVRSAKIFPLIPNVELYPSTFSVAWNGLMINLTPRSYLVFEGLLAKAPKIASSDDIFEYAWIQNGGDKYYEEIEDANNNVHLQIMSIRKKFASAIAQRDPSLKFAAFNEIRAISGVGYYWDGMVAEEISSGDFSFVPEKYLINWKGKKIYLTKAEHYFISVLMKKAKYSGSAEELYRGGQAQNVSAIISVMVNQLNKKFHRISGEEHLVISSGLRIENVYYLNPLLLAPR